MNSSSTTSRRVALVTGASRGIGRAIAVELGRIGLHLLFHYLSTAAEAARTAEEVTAVATHEARAEIYAADVGNDDDRQRLVTHARERFGRLDLLVNNAGIAPEKRVDLLETSAESFDRLLNVNLKGPFFLSQLVARWMIEQKKSVAAYAPAQVNIGSV